ncbi:hypothetical protein EVAR_12862_1 [Eumeta japonica]|uniref:Uncharacterized protein n=1 Tax=Eumeta variegata TaxID=151549 RepID=A0A4C1TW21_EUMVA|nr:hypothetical protein EVAR_12862_1 [Eumeta japonica]
MALERYSVGLQLYVQVRNEFKDQSCKIMSWCDRCCLTEPEGEECEGVRAYGGDMGVLRPKEKRVLIYVYPTRYLHDLFGYCDIDVYYTCDLKNNGRKTVKLPFDTRIYVKSKKRSSCGIFRNYLTPDLKLTRCGTVDLNPLDKCSPVNCDRKYGGHRPFYDRSKKRCAEAPACVGAATNDLPRHGLRTER